MFPFSSNWFFFFFWCLCKQCQNKHLDSQCFCGVMVSSFLHEAQSQLPQPWLTMPSAFPATQPLPSVGFLTMSCLMHNSNTQSQLPQPCLTMPSAFPATRPLPSVGFLTVSCLMHNSKHTVSTPPAPVNNAQCIPCYKTLTFCRLLYCVLSHA